MIFVGILYFMTKLNDLTGKKFHSLKVIERCGYKGKKVLWKCICECGKERTITTSNLVTGNTKSCGCAHIEAAKIHGQCYTRLYKIWAKILQRCLRTYCKGYKHYGGRGISVSEDWLHFENFYRDMKDTYEDHLTIERIDVNGNYEKSNCKWATWAEQATNKRNSLLIDTPWGRMSVIDAATKSGLPKRTIYTRHYKNWSIEKVFNTNYK